MKTATFVQVLKDTDALGIEAARLRWMDIDAHTCTIRINQHVEGSLPGVIKASNKTIAMLNALQADGEYIFNPRVQKTRNRLHESKKPACENPA